jgi:hypothetical protein
MSKERKQNETAGQTCAEQNCSEIVRRMIAAMREADAIFERVGGSTRHHVRDCLLPVLEKRGLRLMIIPNDGGEH